MSWPFEEEVHSLYSSKAAFLRPHPLLVQLYQEIFYAFPPEGINDRAVRHLHLAVQKGILDALATGDAEKARALLKSTANEIYGPGEIEEIRSVLRDQGITGATELNALRSSKTEKSTRQKVQAKAEAPQVKEKPIPQESRPSPPVKAKPFTPLWLVAAPPSFLFVHRQRPQKPSARVKTRSTTPAPTPEHHAFAELKRQLDAALGRLSQLEQKVVHLEQPKAASGTDEQLVRRLNMAAHAVRDIELRLEKLEKAGTENKLRAMEDDISRLKVALEQVERQSKTVSEAQEAQARLIRELQAQASQTQTGGPDLLNAYLELEERVLALSVTTEEQKVLIEETRALLEIVQMQVHELGEQMQEIAKRVGQTTSRPTPAPQSFIERLRKLKP